MNKICPVCNGSGEVATSHRYTCYYCNKGYIINEEKYLEAVKHNKACNYNYNRSVTASEYRAMG